MNIKRTAAALLAALLAFSGCAAKTQNDRSGGNTAAPSGTAAPVYTQPAVPEAPVTRQTAPSEATAPQAEPSSQGAPVPAEPTAAPEPTALPPAAAAEMDRAAAAYGCVGAQAAVIAEGRVRYVWNYGYANAASGTPVTENTKFRVASLSKPVAAMTVLCAAASGAFGLDDDIGALLGYAVRAPRYPDVPITLRMLLTHTSSVADGAAFLESRGAGSSVPLQRLLSQSGSYTGAKPGARYVYSNFGAAALAAGVEKRMNRPFGALANEYRFAPLGLDCAFLASQLKQPELLADLYLPGGGVGWSVRRQLQEAAASPLGQTHHIYQGNLTVSARDYAALTCLLLNGGCAGETRVLPEGAAAEILKTQFSDDGRSCGLFLNISETVVPGRTVYCHTGSNFGMYAAVAFDPHTGTGAVVLTSGAAAAQDGSGIYNVCAKMLRLCFQAAE